MNRPYGFQNPYNLYCADVNAGMYAPHTSESAPSPAGQPSLLDPRMAAILGSVAHSWPPAPQGYVSIPEADAASARPAAIIGDFTLNRPPAMEGHIVFRDAMGRETSRTYPMTFDGPVQLRVGTRMADAPDASGIGPKYASAYEGQGIGEVSEGDLAALERVRRLLDPSSLGAVSGIGVVGGSAAPGGRTRAPLLPHGVGVAVRLDESVDGGRFDPGDYSCGAMMRGIAAHQAKSARLRGEVGGPGGGGVFARGEVTNHDMVQGIKAHIAASARHQAGAVGAAGGVGVAVERGRAAERVADVRRCMDASAYHALMIARGVGLTLNDILDGWEKPDEKAPPSHAYLQGYTDAYADAHTYAQAAASGGPPWREPSALRAPLEPRSPSAETGLVGHAGGLGLAGHAGGLGLAAPMMMTEAPTDQGDRSARGPGDVPPSIFDTAVWLMWALGWIYDGLLGRAHPDAPDAVRHLWVQEFLSWEGTQSGVDLVGRMGSQDFHCALVLAERLSAINLPSIKPAIAAVREDYDAGAPSTRFARLIDAVYRTVKRHSTIPGLYALGSAQDLEHAAPLRQSLDRVWWRNLKQGARRFCYPKPDFLLNYGARRASAAQDWARRVSQDFGQPLTTMEAMLCVAPAHMASLDRKSVPSFPEGACKIGLVCGPEKA